MDYLRQLCLVVAACLLFIRPAAAQESAWAVVDAIWELDPAGRWVEVERSGEAELFRVGDPELVRVLSVGLPLVPGDRVSTADARVRVLFDSQEQIVVEPGSGLDLEERGALQLAGEVLYEVRGVFRVLYGDVEAAVEGTRFSLYEEGGEIVVNVTEGVVRVTSNGQSVQVKRGEQTRAPEYLDTLENPEEAAPAAPADLPPEEAAAARAAARALGEPRLSFALMGGGGLALETARGDSRVMVRYRVARRWRLVAETGFASDGAVFYLPQGVGIERRAGPISVGLKGLGYVTQEINYCEDTTRTELLPGAAADVRLRIPIGPVALESQARVGWVTAPTADIALGVSFAR